MRKKLIKIIIAFILFLITMIFKAENEWINIGLYVISYIIVGFEIIKEAVENIIKGKVFDENLFSILSFIFYAQYVPYQFQKLLLHVHHPTYKILPFLLFYI